MIGKDKVSIRKAVESLKKGFSDAFTMEKVETDVASQLFDKQKDILRKEAKDRDVKLEIEDDVDRIVVRGGPTEVADEGLLLDISFEEDVSIRFKKRLRAISCLRERLR